VKVFLPRPTYNRSSLQSPILLAPVLSSKFQVCSFRSCMIPYTNKPLVKLHTWIKHSRRTDIILSLENALSTTFICCSFRNGAGLRLTKKKLRKKLRLYEVRHKKNETNPIAREPRVGGERQTDGYRTCSDLS